MNADIEWLQTKWGLPDYAVGHVKRLMDEESRGNTACKLENPPADWGNAALGPGTPLVVVRQGSEIFLQSRALHEIEREVARRFMEQAASTPSPLPDFEKQLAAVFPAASPGDRQVAAVRLSLTKNLAVITGGPGTGKTYVLARILALLVQGGAPASSIRLAAPTGKAAHRMGRAVTDSLGMLPPIFADTVDLLKDVACSTLHALLEYNPGTETCRAESLPPDAVLILDECSMIDIHLWRAVLNIFPPTGRLILLGDPNQLESVGQGNVFAGVAKASVRPPLDSSHIHLTEARRFQGRPDIQTLAQTLQKGDAQAVVELLQRCRGTASANGVAWIETKGGGLPFSEYPEQIRISLEKVATAGCPEDALAALEKICILTAQRQFFVGSRATSDEIQTFFSRRGQIRNQPVIINRNDPATGLRNGSVGVIHQDANGHCAAYFPSGQGGLEQFRLAELPDFSLAWAITIHRSQGSEYDDVLAILPREESPMAKRELLYTAVTRAKKNIFVVGDLESAQKAASTPSDRCSMLEYFFA